VTGYISHFGATTSRYLMTMTFLPFDFGSVSNRVTREFFLSYDYELWVMNYWIWSHVCYWEQSLRMCLVTWPVTWAEQKWSKFF